MSKAILRFLAVLGALWLIGMAIVLVTVIGMKGKVPSKTILEANFEQEFLEDVPATPSAQLLLSRKQTLRDVVDAIDRGASDDRVVGMIAKIGAAPMGMAQTQEIRDAVQRFRAHKKFAVAYSETGTLTAFRAAASTRYSRQVRYTTAASNTVSQRSAAECVNV